MVSPEQKACTHGFWDRCEYRCVDCEVENEARWEARVRELEKALREIAVGCQMRFPRCDESARKPKDWCFPCVARRALPRYLRAPSPSRVARQPRTAAGSPSALMGRVDLPVGWRVAEPNKLLP